MAPSPAPPPAVRVSFAEEPDFDALAAILPVANADNPIERFMFAQDSRMQPSAPPPSHRWVLTQLRASVQRPLGFRTYVLKVVVGEGPGEAVGVAIIRVVGGRDKEEALAREGPEEEHRSGKGGSPRSVLANEGEGIRGSGGRQSSGEEVDGDDLLNHDFCGMYMTRLKGLYERHMEGRRHAYWSTLMVLPAWQGRGVGSAMIRWALANLHLDSMPVWLNAQPDGHRLYQKFGWNDVENVDIDLSEWAGPNRGYGMHRTVCMLREPSEGGGGSGR